MNSKKFVCMAFFRKKIELRGVKLTAQSDAAVCQVFGQLVRWWLLKYNFHGDLSIHVSDFKFLGLMSKAHKDWKRSVFYYVYFHEFHELKDFAVLDILGSH